MTEHIDSTAPLPDFADENGQTQHVRVTDWLRDRVIEGEFGPGDRIPEVRTCQRLRISRTPLREAIKVLAAERILTLKPNRGAIVTQTNPQDVDHAMTVIASLEGLAGELMCQRVTPEEIERLTVLTAELTDRFLDSDLLGYFKVNQEIHRLIVEGSRNPTLMETMIQLNNRFARYRYDSNKSPERWKRAIQEHEQILIAISERNVALLGALLRSHVSRGWGVAKEETLAEQKAGRAGLPE